MIFYSPHLQYIIRAETRPGVNIIRAETRPGVHIPGGNPSGHLLRTRQWIDPLGHHRPPP